MAAILEVKHLSKKYDDFTAVDDLSFSVNDGDVYGFLGQNGAGKSTTIRMLLTLIKPTSGDINIFGKSLSGFRNQILSKIGAVIERPDLYKYLSARDNLSIFAKMSGVNLTQKEIKSRLEMVGLADRSKSKVRTFSQGMKQRLGIAVALAHNPDLIILDEPTNGLDPQGIADIRNLILFLSRELKKTILVSSHLLSEIEIIANRMIIIHKGKKIIEGDVQELLDPSHTLLQLQTTNNADAYLKLKESKWGSTAILRDKSIELKLSKDEIPLLTKYMIDLNIGIHAIHPRHTLEAYFLSLTNSESHVEPFAN